MTPTTKLSVETIRHIFKLHSSKTQALIAVRAMLDQQKELGVERTYDAIFDAKRGQGFTVEAQLAKLSQLNWDISNRPLRIFCKDEAATTNTQAIVAFLNGEEEQGDRGVQKIVVEANTPLAAYRL